MFFFFDFTIGFYRALFVCAVNHVNIHTSSQCLNTQQTISQKKSQITFDLIAIDQNTESTFNVTCWKITML